MRDQLITGNSLRARKSLMRRRIDQSIVQPGSPDSGTQRASLDSLLGVGSPLSGVAVRTTLVSLGTADLASDKPRSYRLAPILDTTGDLATSAEAMSITA
jgi:hypothetical protein